MYRRQSGVGRGKTKALVRPGQVCPLHLLKHDGVHPLKGHYENGLLTQSSLEALAVLTYFLSLRRAGWLPASLWVW